MKAVLTDGKRVLGELIFELAAARDARFDAITDMTFETAKATVPLSIASGLEEIAAALIALIPANKPVLPGTSARGCLYLLHPCKLRRERISGTRA